MKRRNLRLIRKVSELNNWTLLEPIESGLVKWCLMKMIRVSSFFISMGLKYNQIGEPDPETWEKFREELKAFGGYLINFAAFTNITLEIDWKAEFWYGKENGRWVNLIITIVYEPKSGEVFVRLSGSATDGKWVESRLSI